MRATASERRWPKSQVVFRAATCVGVAFDADFLLTMASQVGRVHFDQAAVLVRDNDSY